MELGLGKWKSYDRVGKWEGDWRKWEGFDGELESDKGFGEVGTQGSDRGLMEMNVRKWKAFDGDESGKS